jgi:hypothetical protein
MEPKKKKEMGLNRESEQRASQFTKATNISKLQPPLPAKKKHVPAIISSVQVDTITRPTGVAGTLARTAAVSGSALA